MPKFDEFYGDKIVMIPVPPGAPNYPLVQAVEEIGEFIESPEADQVPPEM